MVLEEASVVVREEGLEVAVVLVQGLVEEAALVAVQAVELEAVSAEGAALVVELEVVSAEAAALVAVPVEAAVSVVVPVAAADLEVVPALGWAVASGEAKVLAEALVEEAVGGSVLVVEQEVVLAEDLGVAPEVVLV